MSARIVTIAVVAVVVAAGARPAAAQQRVVGLLDVRGDGVEPVVLERFAAAIEEGMESTDELVAAPRSRMHEMLEQSSWSSACLVGKCLVEVKQQTGADLVVVGGLTGSGESYRFTVTILDTTTGQVIDQSTDSCPACTLEDVATQVTLATIELINAASELPVAAPPVASRSDGRGRGHARAARVAGLVTLGVAVLAAGIGYYFHDDDRDELGYPLLGAGVGLAVGGTAMLGLSLRF